MPDLSSGAPLYVYFHPTLMTSANKRLGFLRLLTEPCPNCSHSAKGPMLGIIMERPEVETVHCTSCDYQETRRPKPTQLPPMNSSRR